jgi:hypothetical protein
MTTTIIKKEIIPTSRFKKEYEIPPPTDKIEQKLASLAEEQIPYIEKYRIQSLTNMVSQTNVVSLGNKPIFFVCFRVYCHCMKNSE